jgi:hypothetical protein
MSPLSVDYCSLRAGGKHTPKLPAWGARYAVLIRTAFTLRYSSIC